MTLKQITEYTPGHSCKCNAVCDHECACDADWTPRDVLFLEWKLTRYSMCVRDFFLEYQSQSVSAQTEEALSNFAEILNEPLRVDFQINPKLEPWVDVG